MRARLSEAKRRVERTLHRYRNPVTPEQTRRAIDKLLGSGVELLFMHSSLSACGRFTGGPDDLLAALREVSGTLGLPTHTYTYPARVDEPAPVFDYLTAPSQNGALSELFRKTDGAVRSIHSTHSLAAAGPAAADITRNHYLCETAAGAGTPYARMLDARVSALMWGVSFHSYTFYHTAEDAAGSPLAYEPETRDKLRIVDESGNIQTRTSRRQTRDPRRFAEAGDLLERKGLVQRTGLGASHLLFVPDCAKVHDFLVEKLRKTPDFLYRTCKVPLE